MQLKYINTIHNIYTAQNEISIKIWPEISELFDAWQQLQ